MARLSSERHVVQSPLVRYAVEAGWTYVSPDDALTLRKGEASPLFVDVLIDRLQALNPGRIDAVQAAEAVRRFAGVPPSIEGNLQAWEYLKGLKTVFVPSEKRELNLTLLDFADPSRNVFHVTDEFSFTNGVHRIRADVVLLINGIPVLFVETKAATKLEGVAEALDQVRRYHREAPELVALSQLFTLSHLVQFYYGATWNLAAKDLFNWKDEFAGKDFETLVKAFVAPERILRIIADFILFTRRDDELKKVVLRPHQMRAVDRALGRARDSSKRRGLVWHTQGSGKTFTMITLARKLIELPAFDNPTVLMLVDRNELESQLFGNLASTVLGEQPRPIAKPGYWTRYGDICVAESKRGLLDLLQADTRGLVVSMIHKFDDIPANVVSRENVFVLVDEAHRTTGGQLGDYLMGALPNATYLGFTGTPIDKTAYGQGTFKVFGTDDPETGYLDKYSIRESIEDGTTVPLFYSLAPNELRVDRDTLDREFLDLKEAEGLSDPEDLTRILEKAVNLRNMLKNRERVQRIAQYVATHYRETVEPMGFKAFLVAVDREACVLYKEALDQYLPPEYSAVVISPGFNDDETLARHHLTEDQEKQLRKDFLKPEANPKILIVTEKLLTGYDAPVLYCMYLDKPMRDHVLLQAIARVNRPYEDENGKHKPGGFVLDFVGIFDNLEKALAFDSQDVQSVIEGLDLLKQRFAEQMEKARTDVLPLTRRGGSMDKVAEAVLQHFIDEERRHDFYRFYRELEDLYEIISPDAFLRDFIDDYNRLANMYALLRATYEGVSITDRELARKTARLVQEHTQVGVLREAVGVYEINADTIDKISESGPDNIKVFNLLKSIENKVGESLRTSPYLLDIGERAEQIAQAFKDRQISTQEALKALEELIREINQAEKERAEKGISAESFAVYWVLRQATVPDAEHVAVEMNQAFSQYPHFRTDEAQARQVRRRLYELLVGAPPDGVPSIVENVMRLLLRDA
jgi:type I restriction enzyme R subunit